MLDALIVLFAFYGATFLIKESSILAIPRNWLIRHSSFFANLLSCFFCTGWWCGLGIYLLHEDDYNFRDLILWGLAGAAVSFIFDAIVIKLTWFKE